MNHYHLDLSISLVEVGSLVLQTATFVVLLLTLRAVAAYTRETKGLAEGGLGANTPSGD